MSRVYHYYNEFDPVAAAWLRQLIKAKLIPEGFVDERSITDVDAGDLKGFRQCHFFAGIAGWPLALQIAGISPDRELWTGSPPCQPFSNAGRQLGQFDPRHLAPVFLRLVSECRPPALFGEQVAAAISKSWMCDLQTHMEEEGYAVGFAVLPACSVGAPHKRDRLFFGSKLLVHPDNERKPAARYETGFTDIDGASQPFSSVANGDDDRQQPGGRGERRSKSPAARDNPGRCRSHDRVANTDDARPQGREGMPQRTDEQPAWAGSVANGVADAEGHRRKQYQDFTRGGNRGIAQGLVERITGNNNVGNSNPHHGFWSDADWLGCRDGKFRPVESGTFPLANGIPARVGRLRGYGNAIVPQIAAEFIRAFESAFNDLPNDGRF